MLLRLPAILALAFPVPAGAQDRPDTTRMPDLVVRAPEAVTTIGGSSAVRARLDSLALPAAATVEQVLRALPSLHVRRNSRGEAELSVRGSGSRQVAVLLDGIPLTLSWDGRADWSVIPATAPQEIRVVRGVSSMLHGPNVLGGVVELSVGQSLLQPRDAAADIAVEGDHVGGVAARVTALLPFGSRGRWLVRGGMGYRSSPGDPLARGVVEPLPAGRRLRVNTDTRSLDAFASVRYHAPAGAWVSWSGSGFDAERGIAAELETDNARFWRYPEVRRLVTAVSAGTGMRRSPFGGTGDLEASLGLDAHRTAIDAYASRGYDSVTGFERGDGRTVTARLLGDQTLGPRGDLRLGLTLADIRHDESLPGGEARYRQELRSAGLETVWRLVEGRRGIRFLRLSLGGARDAARTPETGGREPLGTLTGWGARAGFTMGLGGGSTLVHGSLSRRARFPALRELYSGALDRFAPNPDLGPETLVVLETGLTVRPGRDTDLQVTVFRQRLNDAVVRIVLPDRRFMRVNRDRLESTGVEAVVSTRLGPVAVSGDATLQSVKLTDPAGGGGARPENLPEAAAALRAAFPVALGVAVMIEGRSIGRQYCLHPGTGLETALEGRTVLNGILTRQWRLARPGRPLQRFETRLALDNAGGVALWDQCGLPQPGRLARLQLRVF
jgi:iron complex outermembrane receptor protein